MVIGAVVVAIGSIPARAGETFALSAVSCAAMAFTGSIPARAGETCAKTLGYPPTGVYPRTGGGNRLNTFLAFALYGLSPHGRGKLKVKEPVIRLSRSIPARAGETPRGRR